MPEIAVLLRVARSLTVPGQTPVERHLAPCTEYELASCTCARITAILASGDGNDMATRDDALHRLMRFAQRITDPEWPDAY